MKIRRLNDVGLQRMSAFLDSQTTDSPMTYPEELLTERESTEHVEPEVEVEQRLFVDRFEVGEYLNTKLGDACVENIERDRGIWAWLSLFYFDQLCPVGTQGRRKPGELARWIPATGDFRKYYRHLLAGPFRIYRAHRDHPDRARVLLCTPPHSPGDIVEQLASRQEIVTNSAIIQVATCLYIDPDTGQPKRGAAGRGGGSARRLADVLNQFDMTWDLYAMTSQSIIELIPPEFDRFR